MASDPVTRVLNVARSQIGIVERESNVVDYWTELDPQLQGQSWCAAFVSWVFKHANVPLPHMDRDYGYMNCISAVSWAQKHGRLFSTPQVGDIALYGRRGLSTHTGIVETVSRNGRDFMAIEGNTAVGNDTNGGAVMRRQRNVSWVVCFLRPDWKAWDKAPAAPIITRPVESIVYNPPLMLKPIVAELKAPNGGVWLAAADGDLYCFGNAPYRREWDAIKVKDFKGHIVDHLELPDPARGEDRDGHVIVFVDTDNNRFAP